MESKILLAGLVLFIVYTIGRRLAIRFNPNVKNISVSQAYQLMREQPDLMILDVRTEDEYRNGHLPGAVLVPVKELSKRIDEIADSRGKPVLVYCASGGRSPDAVRILIKHKFTHVYHLYAGLAAWVYERERI